MIAIIKAILEVLDLGGCMRSLSYLIIRLYYTESYYVIGGLYRP